MLTANDDHQRRVPDAPAIFIVRPSFRHSNRLHALNSLQMSKCRRPLYTPKRLVSLCFLLLLTFRVDALVPTSQTKTPTVTLSPTVASPSDMPTKTSTISPTVDRTVISDGMMWAVEAKKSMNVTAISFVFDSNEGTHSFKLYTRKEIGMYKDEDIHDSEKWKEIMSTTVGVLSTGRAFVAGDFKTIIRAGDTQSFYIYAVSQNVTNRLSRRERGGVRSSTSDFNLLDGDGIFSGVVPFNLQDGTNSLIAPRVRMEYDLY
eukprot:scaffold148076_cov57-Attheya_sp.AAC.1